MSVPRVTTYATLCLLINPWDKAIDKRHAAAATVTLGTGTGLIGQASPAAAQGIGVQESPKANPLP